MKSVLLAAAAALLSAASTQGATLAYSGLEGQATGVLSNTINDGTGWNTWDPQNETAGHDIANATPLTFGSLATSSEGNYVTGGGNWTSVGRRLTTSSGGAFESAGHVSDPWTAGTIDSGTLWVSFLTRVNSTGTGAFFQFHQENIAWSDGSGIKIGNQGNTWSAALTSGTYATTAAAIQANTTTLMVGRFGFDGANSSFHFWAFSNPADVTLGGADLSLASATSSITGVASTDMDFKAFKAYLDNSGANRAAMDEIRFGESFADVSPMVPEPTALASLLTSGLLLVRRRK